jgi:hypothetical protein
LIVRPRRWELSLSCVLIASVAPIAQQQQTPREMPAGPSRPVARPQSPSAALGSLKEIMDGIVDPTSEFLFEAVSYDLTTAGVEERKPSNDHEWAQVRRHALLLAEASNLLKIPGRRVAPQNPFLELEADPKGPTDLTPAQIQSLIDRDRGAFNRLADALGQAAMLALRAAEAKDADAVFDAGDASDRARENRNKKYWYQEGKAPRAPPRSTRKK